MKVCLVSLYALPALSIQHKDGYLGGAEVQLAQLAITLNRLGHEVSLMVLDSGQPDGAIFEGVKTLKTFKTSAGLPMIRFVYPRWTSLWAAARRADADVYYYSCSGMLLGLLAMFCKLHGKRLVYRMASDADCDLNTVLIDSRRDKWLYAYGLRRADAVLVQSASQQAALAKNFGISSSVIRGLVETPRSDRAATKKDIDVLWLANLRQLKRPDRLLEIARALPEFSFHMAGGEVEGGAAYYAQVEAMAREVPNLTFHGKIPYMDVGLLFDRARLFANTSEVEGFPNTFLQAWIRGIPVATMFDPDAMVAREGLGASCSTVPEMISAVRTLLTSPAEHARYSDTALRFMARDFGDSKVVGGYLDALSGEPFVLKQQRPQSAA